MASVKFLQETKIIKRVSAFCDIVIVATQKQYTRRDTLMRNSIQHFIGSRIKNLQESAKKFSQSPQNIAGFVVAVKEEARLFRRKFLTYEQAGVIYSMSHRKLRDIAEAAGAVYRINKRRLLL